MKLFMKQICMQLRKNGWTDGGKDKTILVI